MGAEVVDFTFAGTSWTTANSDVIRLIFNSEGTLTRSVLGGSPNGFSQVMMDIHPDILLNTGLAGRDRPFSYTTSQSPQFGVFVGTVTSWSAEPAPVPEPAP